MVMLHGLNHLCMSCDRMVVGKGRGGCLGKNQVLHPCFGFMLITVDIQKLQICCLIT